MRPVALGRIFVYFAKKLSTSVVDECDRRVSPWQNFVRLYQTSKKPRQKIGELKGLFSGDFIALFCFFSVAKYIRTFQRGEQVWCHVSSKARQPEKYFSATIMDRENFARFPYQNFDFQRFQGAAGVGPYMSLLTDEQEQRGSSFNFQIFPIQIIKEPSLRSIFPEPTSSIADASAAAAQKKKQYETLTKEEEKYCASLKSEIFEKGKQFDWCFGHKDKIVTFQCDRV